MGALCGNHGQGTGGTGEQLRQATSLSIGGEQDSGWPGQIWAIAGEQQSGAVGRPARPPEHELILPVRGVSAEGLNIAANETPVGAVRVDRVDL